MSSGWCSWPGLCWSAGAGSLLCLQGLKERAYASSGEAITSLPVSIPLSTVQPSKLPVSIPLASVVLPSRAEKVVSARREGQARAPGYCCSRSTHAGRGGWCLLFVPFC